MNEVHQVIRRLEEIAKAWRFMVGGFAGMCLGLPGTVHLVLHATAETRPPAGALIQTMVGAIGWVFAALGLHFYLKASSLEEVPE